MLQSSHAPQAPRARPPAPRSLSSSGSSSSAAPATPDAVAVASPFDSSVDEAKASTGRQEMAEGSNSRRTSGHGYGHARGSSDLSASFAATGGPIMSGQRLGGKSREELERMLMQADELILRKEQELAIAASAGKTLLEDNMALRSKHHDLAAKLGSNERLSVGHAPSLVFSPSVTAFVPGLASTGGDHDDVPPLSPRKRFSARMHLRDASGSDAGTVDSFTQPSNRRSRPRTHSLRSSAPGTPLPDSPHKASPALSNSSSLAALDYRNAELAAQVEDLQAETARADRVGKQKLRKLDKELAGLREELDRVVNTNEELERRLAASAALAQQHAAKARAAEADVEGDAADYAWPAQPLPVNFARARRTSKDDAATTPTATPVLLPAELPALDDERNSGTPSEAVTPELLRQDVHESMIVAQLLAKINELETTNDSISAHREELDERLERAQVELDGLRYSYEELESDLRRQEEQEGPLVIGWHGQNYDDEPESPTHRRALGNKRLIEQRKKSVAPLGTSTEKKRPDAARRARATSLRMSSSSHSLIRKSSRPTLRKASSRSAFFGEDDLAAPQDDDEDIMDALRREDRERLLVPDAISAAHSRSSSPHRELGNHTLGSELGSTWGQSPSGTPTRRDRHPRYEDEEEVEVDEQALQLPQAARHPAGLPGRSPPRPDHRYFLHSGPNAVDEDVFGDIIPLGGLRDSSRPDEEAYDMLDRAASELPISWADEASPRRQINWQRGPTFHGGLVYEDASDDEIGGDVWAESNALQIESAEMVAERERQERNELRRQARLRLVAESETASTVTTGSRDQRDSNALRRRAAALRRLNMASRGDGEVYEDELDDFVAVEGPRRRTGRGRDYWPVAFRARYAPSMVVDRFKTRVAGPIEQVMAWIQAFAIVAFAVMYAVSQGPTAVLGQGQRRLRRD